LTRSWEAIRHQEQFGRTISIGLHRGTLYTFRSFLYGRDVWMASQLQSASAKLLGSEENGIFVTAAVRSALFGTPSPNRLQPVALVPLAATTKCSARPYVDCWGAGRFVPLETSMIAKLLSRV
jgi:hypothetical protein